MLEVRGVEFTYRTGGRRVPALTGVDFTLAPGEIWAVIGPSGCGKSTLLYLLAGLLRPTRGEIRFRGGPPLAHQREIALILQGYGLFPWKTVRDNVALGLQIRGVPPAESRRRTEEILATVGLAEYGDFYPEELSGGQKQRVAIARSFVLEPALLLMDEPFSALDALTRERLQNLLLSLCLSREMGTVLVTHNIEEAVFLGRRILVMTRRPGRVAAIVDNPDMGQEGYRASAAFLARTTRLRELFRDPEMGGEELGDSGGDAGG
ncbi:MAG: ABC transporter ATP-binding protein [Bacillota bacterium]|nr:ABC transporter ATP-binding protein [Bacillota bacterium]